MEDLDHEEFKEQLQQMQRAAASEEFQKMWQNMSKAMEELGRSFAMVAEKLVEVVNNIAWDEITKVLMEGEEENALEDYIRSRQRKRMRDAHRHRRGDRPRGRGRQAAIDALENDKEVLDQIIRGMSANDAQLDHYVAQHNQVVYDIDVIKQLPPIQPKRGKWERHYSRPNVYADLFWHCSECGYRSSDNWADKFNFCPHCGADMRGDKNA